LSWKLNANTFGNSNGGNYCLSVGDDLKFNIDCAEYKGNSYGFVMNYSPVAKDPSGLYWNIDLNTFSQKNPSGNTGSLVETFDNAAIYQPYQVVLLKVNNYKLTDESYNAKFGDKDVSIMRLTDDMMGFMISDINPGSYVLSGQLGGISYQITFSIEALSTVANPDAFINDFIANILTDVDSMINDLDNSPQSQALKTELQRLKTDLESQHAKISTLSGADKQILSNLLMVNFSQIMRDMTINKRTFDKEACISSGKTLVKKVIGVMFWASATVYSVKAGAVMAETGVGVIIGIAFGVTASAISAIYFIDALNDAIASLGNALDKCIFAYMIRLTKEENRSKRSSDTLGFESGKSQKMSVQTTFRMENGDVVKSMDDLKGVIASISNFLPSSIINSLGLDGVNLSTEKVEKSNPSNFVISDISDGNITGKANPSGDKLELTFTYKGTSTETVPFTFILTDKVNKVSTTVSATVKPQIKPCNQSGDSGKDTPETNSYSMGKTSGTFDFSYNTQTVKDQIVILYEGKVIYDTGCVGKSGTASVSFSGNTDFVTVSVRPNCDGTQGTKWSYGIGCPK